MPILDRRIPSDWKHVEKHRMVSRAAPEHAAELILPIPRQYRVAYDQGARGACVGYSQTWLMSILNRVRYDPLMLYDYAQMHDEYDDTPPEEGTSVRAGMDALRTVGHWTVYASKTKGPFLKHGIASNKWTTSVDDVRAALTEGVPVNLGINWYEQFFSPVPKARIGRPSHQSDYWIGQPDVQWGGIAGGHAITVVGISDERQAMALCNTWGTSYPFIVWLPYSGYERLMNEYGETAVVTDRL